jgi:hypothetical protein
LDQNGYDLDTRIVGAVFGTYPVPQNLPIRIGRKLFGELNAVFPTTSVSTWYSASPVIFSSL